jgi:rare lipoprotein A
MRIRLLIALVLALTVSAGCRKKTRIAQPPRPGAHETGVASWYGEPYHGRRAANGEIYDMEKMTAAHRTLPFSTWVRVKNLTNERFCEVRITDRGPFVDGRIIDLSRAAARSIEMLGPGTARVELTIIAPPKDMPPQELFAVQVGAFRERERAERLRSDMEIRYGKARVIERFASPPVWRVLVGEEDSSEAAAGLAERISGEGTPAFVVRIDLPPGS